MIFYLRIIVFFTNIGNPMFELNMAFNQVVM
jgi:hypothetical protein